MLVMASIDLAREKLREVFGFEDFLDGQESVIGEILSGRDGSVVMPTGGGKSLCYQLPALCREGVTLVVSPLIALMKDQVDALEKRGAAVTLINSTLTWPEQKERLEGMRNGAFQLVYIAPERFRAGSFMEALRDVKIEPQSELHHHAGGKGSAEIRPA